MRLTEVCRTSQVDACLRCLAACLAVLSFYELWVMNTKDEILSERLSGLSYAHDPPSDEVGVPQAAYVEMIHLPDGLLQSSGLRPL
jgi:hypothetical protein